MCFVLTLFQVNPRFPVIVAANREEARVRPSRSPFRWPGEPALWAGRDEVAGGTWLGVNAAGVLAAVTNRRAGEVDASLPSRGLFCLGTLRQPSPTAARAFVERELVDRRYNPFNLLCVRAGDGWVATWRGDFQPLSAGVHVLSNRGDLDDPELAVIRRARALIEAIDPTEPALDSLLSALGRLCADTDGPDPICRVGGAYGTVSSSLIALRPDGSIAAYRHAPGPPSETEYAVIRLDDG